LSRQNQRCAATGTAAAAAAAAAPVLLHSVCFVDAGVADYVLDLHHRSPHIVQKVAVPQEHQHQELSLQQLLTNQGKKVRGLLLVMVLPGLVSC
jgi:predicted deacylase